MNTNQLFDGYENMKHRHYEELDRSFPNSFWYDELPQNEIKGVLKANRWTGGSCRFTLCRTITWALLRPRGWVKQLRI